MAAQVCRSYSCEVASNERFSRDFLVLSRNRSRKQTLFLRCGVENVKHANKTVFLAVVGAFLATADADSTGSSGLGARPSARSRSITRKHGWSALGRADRSGTVDRGDRRCPMHEFRTITCKF